MRRHEELPYEFRDIALVRDELLDMYYEATETSGEEWIDSLDKWTGPRDSTLYKYLAMAKALDDAVEAIVKQGDRHR